MNVLWLLSFAAAAGASGCAVATSALPGRPIAVRLTGAIVVAIACLQAVFLALSPGGWFRPTIAAAALSVVAVVAVRVGCGRDGLVDQIRGDAAGVARWARALDRPTRAVAGGLALVALLVVVHTLLAPPYVWDSLSYHLVKAADWVQGGGFAPMGLPDAGRYYDHFAPGGEVLSAWSLMASASGAFIGLGEVLVWGGIAVAGRAAAAGLHLDGRRSDAAGLAIATVPAVVVFVGSANVDNLVLLSFLAGTALLLDVSRHDGRALGALAVASVAFGIGAATKQSFVPIAVLGWVWCLIVGTRRHATLGAALGVLGGMAIAAPWYVRAWADQGSPFFPFRLPAPFDGLPSEPALTRLLDGSELGYPPPAPGLRGYWDTALRALDVTDGPANWPPAPLIWLGVGAVGLVVSMLGRGAGRRPPVFLPLAALVSAYGILSPDNMAIIENDRWAAISTRLVLPAVAVIVLCAASLPGELVAPCVLALAAVQLLLAASQLLLDWSGRDAAAIADLLGRGWPALLLVAAGLAVLRSPRRTSNLARGAVVVLVVAGMLVAGSALEATRRSQRAAFYAAADRDEALRLHNIGSLSCAWPLWEAVDLDHGVRVDVSTGYYPPGQHNLRFPFYGSDLQNDVMSLPFSADGEVVHLADLAPDVDPRSLIDPDAWLERLEVNDVEFVAFFGPEPPQAAGIEARSERFELVAEGTCADGGRLYRLLPGSVGSQP